MCQRFAGVILLVTVVGCHGSKPKSPTTSGGVVIDRFSAAAGHLMVRSDANRLPGPDQPIDLDKPPFITQGFGPDGAVVRYYNFDIQPAAPAPRYRLTHAGAHAALPNELDIVDAIPGQPGYSDFWQINWVEVPDTFGAGSITSFAQINDRGFTVTADPQIIDCPVVPNGTTPHMGAGVGPAVTTTVMYRGTHVTCLAFGEALTPDGGKVPTSPIYVTFAKNPPAPDGGPKSGFSAEAGTPQTHNVVFSVPGDSEYSPLWAVHIYDHVAFASVRDAKTASKAPVIEPNGPLVNCPVVYVAHKN